MRRKDREMPMGFAYEVADRCQWAVLGLIGPGGPYGVPVSIARVGDSVYFHSAQEGMKTDCIRADSRICLTCVGSTRTDGGNFTVRYESAILTGRAVEVTGEEEKLLGLRAICEKYAPEHMDKFQRTVDRSLPATAVWRADITGATGKRNK